MMSRYFLNKYTCIWITLVYFVKSGLSQSVDLPVIKEHPKSQIAIRNNPETLKCLASRADKVQWFRNGDPVITTAQDTESHRIILPDGSLFFLRLTSNKRETDAGTYWCVVFNSHGAVRSKNATLIISSLEETFQLNESAQVQSRAGESVILGCRPPKGTPTPTVQWKHDGHLVVNNTRVYTVGQGDLVFEEVTQSDDGKYVCVASNNAGTRHSQPTTLSVMSKPWFKESPQNKTAIAGSTIELRCKVRGTPFPTVTWKRLHGKMAAARKQILPGNTLQIDDLSASDSGEYMCEATSKAGTARAVASLRVVAAPEVKEKPGNALLLVNKNLVLRCKVQGEPQPLLVWRLPSKELPTHLIGGQTTRRASVSNDSTVLRINQMQIDDMGSYMCWGISNGGGVTSRSDVVVVSALPPPLIGVRPKDLISLVGSKVTFPCEVVSEAAEHTVTWWHQRAAHLDARQISPSSSVSILPIGTLLMREIRQDDAGIYTCKVTSDAGNVEAEAILKVTSEAFHERSHSYSAIPAPPSKPKIMTVNSTSVSLSWLPNSRVTSEANQLYRIEYWRAPWQEWRLAKEEVFGESYTIGNLLANTAHVFSVRAIDPQGEESFPSPWSDVIYTTHTSPFTKAQQRKTTRRMNSPSVFLTSATVVGTDSVALAWKLLDTVDTPVDGVTVYAVGAGDIQTVSVLRLPSSTYVATQLESNTQYTFFVVPFWKSIEGVPSNSHIVQTQQIVPLVSPRALTLEVYKSGTTLLQWEPLTNEDVGSRVLGYKVSISHNNTSTVKETQNPFIETQTLIQGRFYSVKVACVTDGGTGPWSSPQVFQIPVRSVTTEKQPQQNADQNLEPSIIYAPLHPAWILYLLLPLLLCVLGAAALYIRHLRKKSVPASPDMSNGAVYADGGMHTPHLINMYGEQKLWRPESDKDSSISSTRLLRPEHLANEYAEPRIRRISDTTEPYATTALLAPASPPPMCGNSPSWKYARCGNDNSIQVNWGAFLPPPPIGPPPTDVPSHDGETCSSGTTSSEGRDRKGYASSSSHYENGAGSEQYEHPCDATSEHTYDIYTPAPHLIGRIDSAGTPAYYVLQSGSVRGPPLTTRPSELPQNNTH